MSGNDWLPKELQAGASKKKRRRNKKGGGKQAAASGAAEAAPAAAAAEAAASLASTDASAASTAAPAASNAPQSGEAGPKKRKRKKKGAQLRGVTLLNDQEFRALHTGQTFPPTKPVASLYPDGVFPEGFRIEYKDFTVREEHLDRDRVLLTEDRVKSLRHAGRVHSQVRQAVQRHVKPGMTMVEIVEYIEKMNHNLLGFDPAEPKKRSWGFPTGCSLNHVAAHYTPNHGDTTVLQAGDVCKIDFGSQVNGHIIDSAFTMTFDSKWDTLMEAVKDATYTGIRTIGPDVRVCDVGAAVYEAMTSYEVEIDGTLYPVKPIKNLNGHNILPYKIHGGKSIPLHDTGDNTKMDEGELFALETFGAVGPSATGAIHDYGECSHYGLDDEQGYATLRTKAARNLLHHIKRRHGTLPFCRRWLDDDGQTRHLLALKQLVDTGLVTDYPPLADGRAGSCWTAQYEHTILMRPTGKELLSKSSDF